jgi:2'-5' RNA ligase
MSFIGVRINHEAARLFHEIDVPGVRYDSAQLHITLLYLGHNTPIDTLAAAMVATYSVAQTTFPFWAKSTSVASFPVEVNSPHPIIANIQSPKILQLHKNLKKSLNKAGVEYSKKFKLYRPHITLAFNEAGIKKTKIEPIEWSVQEIVLWGGNNGDNRVFTTFPLEIRENETISELCCKK